MHCLPGTSCRPVAVSQADRKANWLVGSLFDAIWLTLSHPSCSTKALCIPDVMCCFPWQAKWTQELKSNACKTWSTVASEPSRCSMFSADQPAEETTCMMWFTSWPNSGKDLWPGVSGWLIARNHRPPLTACCCLCCAWKSELRVVGLSKNINIFKYILIISKYYNTLRQGHIVSPGAYGVLQYDTIRLQYDTGVVFNHIIWRTDSLAFRLQYSKSATHFGTCINCTYWGVADSLSIEDIIGSIKFY